jgi:hypothetical protein
MNLLSSGPHFTSTSFPSSHRPSTGSCIDTSEHMFVSGSDGSMLKLTSFRGGWLRRDGARRSELATPNAHASRVNFFDIFQQSRFQNRPFRNLSIRAMAAPTKESRKVDGRDFVVHVVRNDPESVAKNAQAIDN